VIRAGRPVRSDDIRAVLTGLGDLRDIIRDAEAHVKNTASLSTQTVAELRELLIPDSQE
jgi:hypothetical protein